MWLLYLDNKTDARYKDIMSDLCKKYNFICPIYMSNKMAMSREFDHVVKKGISERGNAVTHLIVTRLDNDDCLRYNAIDKVQGYFREQRYEVLNFSKGYCLQIEPVMRLSLYTYPNGPFLSIIRDLNLSQEYILKHKVRDIYARHTRVTKEGAVTQISDKAYWVQTIHGDNISNRMRGRLSMDKKVLDDFGIDTKNIHLSLDHFMPEQKRGRVSWDPEA